jgi:hypothetical protein
LLANHDCQFLMIQFFSFLVFGKNSLLKKCKNM